MSNSVKPSSGMVALISGIVIMLAAVALYCVAFQTDGTNALAYWLWALALSLVGVFVWNVGMKQQRVAALAERRDVFTENKVV